MNFHIEAGSNGVAYLSSLPFNSIYWKGNCSCNDDIASGDPNDGKYDSSEWESGERGSCKILLRRSQEWILYPGYKNRSISRTGSISKKDFDIVNTDAVDLHPSRSLCSTLEDTSS